jgi:hypothetical protein
VPAQGTFVLPGGLGIYGGFTGVEDELDGRNPDPARAAAPRLVGNGSNPVVQIGANVTTLDGFRVQGGGESGIKGVGDDARLANLRISNNSSGGELAGGVQWEGGTGLVMDHVTIATNSGRVGGGVVLDDGTEATITDSVVRSNVSTTGWNCGTAPAPTCQGGGGVSVHDSEVRLERVRIVDNVGVVGGGIDASGDSTVRVITADISDNRAVGNGLVVGRGGGIHATGARVLLSNCLIGGNQALVGPSWSDPNEDGFGGGIFAATDADVRMINCTVARNNGAGAIIAGDEQSESAGFHGGNVEINRHYVVDLDTDEGGRPEVQELTIDATGGTFELKYHNRTTTDIAFDVGAAGLQDALEALSTIEEGDVVVTAITGGFRLTWRGGLGDVDLPTLLVGSLTGSAEIVTTQAGLAGGVSDPIVIRGAGATVQNSVFLGNTMTWSPVTIERFDSCNEDACPFATRLELADRLLGVAYDWSGCLGDDQYEAFYVYSRSCLYSNFAGTAFTASTELRSDTVERTPDGADEPRGVLLVHSMIGSGSTVATLDDDDIDCAPIDYYGRSESPTVAGNRGPAPCGDDAHPNQQRNGILVGLRGRGYVGTATFRVPAPADNDPDRVYDAAYRLVASSRAVDAGNELVDWDPFTAGVQDAPDFDLAGNRRVVGPQIDLGPYEVQ